MYKFFLFVAKRDSELYDIYTSSSMEKIEVFEAPDDPAKPVLVEGFQLPFKFMGKDTVKAIVHYNTEGKPYLFYISQYELNCDVTVLDSFYYKEAW